jgi:L-ascorbate metabolism protein UlaG (beta-lactamase superfamily)
MRRIVKTAVIGAATAAAAVAVERCVAAPHYHGPVTDHFDGERFRNREQAARQGSFLKWQLTREPGFWPAWVDAAPGPPPPRRVGGGRMRVTFINHATLLIQMDDLNILTDPIWSERTSPVSFAGPRRHRPPGIRFDDLPPIDLVVVSHNHYDHLDIPTLQRLQQRDRPRIITPLGNGALMRRHGIEGAIELDWWKSVGVAAPGHPPAAPAHHPAAPSAPLRAGFATAATLAITLVPARHFCARAISDRDRNLWGGFVISGPSGNAYFAGDTGWGAHFAEIGARFGPMRVALLPIGAYLPRWFMQPVHIDPAQAVDAHLALGARTSIPMHYGTFFLGDDGIDEPLRDLQSALAAKGNPNFVILENGEGRDLP